MTARKLLAFGTATAAALAAMPALAQDMSYEERTYEYAQATPAGAGEVIYRQEPVVQPLPEPDVAPMPAPVAAPQPDHAPDHASDHGYEGEEEYETAAPPMAHHPMPVHTMPVYTMGYPVPVGHPMPHGIYMAHHPQAGAYPPPYPDFDRAAWLDDCESKVHGKDDSKRGGIIGGLLGAIAGGVIGNRAWDSERLAGTLIGAGTGGIVGMAIGSAIGGKGRSDRDYCEAYLDRYLMGAGGYGHGYYGYMMVPVMVAVPQRAVVREYVTEEWVDTPAGHKPAKKVRTIKQAPVKTKTIKYSKGS